MRMGFVKGKPPSPMPDKLPAEESHLASLGFLGFVKAERLVGGEHDGGAGVEDLLPDEDGVEDQRVGIAGEEHGARPDLVERDGVGAARRVHPAQGDVEIGAGEERAPRLGDELDQGVGDVAGADGPLQVGGADEVGAGVPCQPMHEDRARASADAIRDKVDPGLLRRMRCLRAAEGLGKGLADRRWPLARFDKPTHERGVGEGRGEASGG